MNILFIAYGDLTSNSMTHIGPYAEELGKRGHHCALAIPDDSTLSPSPSPTLPVVHHADLPQRADLFPNSQPAHVLHAWTPRENVRQATQAYRALHPTAKLVIHLEDNEDAILESYYQTPLERLRHPHPNDAPIRWQTRLSHPTKYKDFLATADGITLLNPRLAKLLPIEKQSSQLRPILQPAANSAPQNPAEVKATYLIPTQPRIVVYPGGITSNNREDIRNLYKAVKILNDQAQPTLIVKTGPSCQVFENSFDFPIQDVSLDLGYVQENDIQALLSIADALVQPGTDNPFNRDRFPCKIPQFLASGRPCILPAFYTGPDSIDPDSCLTLDSNAPEEIASQLQRVFSDPQLAAKLGQAAKAHAAKTYAPDNNVSRILDFYQRVLHIDRSGSGFPQVQSRSPKRYPLASLFERLKLALPRRSSTTPQTEPPPNHPVHHRDYFRYLKTTDRQAAQYATDFQARLESLPSQPKISILLPVYNVPEKWLRRCIDSVLSQIYPHWELCIADDFSSAKHIRPTIERYAKRDPRIKAVFRPQNGHISLATNAAYTLATGDYIALLDHDDELPPHALAKLAETIIANPQAKIIYSDEDKIDEDGIRHGPHFKSDWNYDLFLGCNMISHLGAYRKDAFESVQGFRQGYEGAQDWDLALRIAETSAPSEIVHIPEALYHWRSIASSTADNLDAKDYAYQAQRKAIQSHLDRIGVQAPIESVAGLHWRLRYPLPTPQPRVSIVIPTKDRLDLLKPCVESVLQKTAYRNYEILVVDNASQDPETIQYLQALSNNRRISVTRDPGPFNYSALNNHAIRTTGAQVICLLNNDTEVIAPQWLDELVSHAIRPGIGAVGAKLLFPHQHVQHCGVVMGIGGVAAHAFKFLHRDDDGYIHRAQLVSGYSAVTGACMAFEKRLWEELEGLDEVNLPISYNDVDFCLRAAQRGYRNLVTPFALLYHKESETRGDSQSPIAQSQFQKESDYMQKKWASIIARDPYYNPNLSKEKEDFSYRC